MRTKVVGRELLALLAVVALLAALVGGGALAQAQVGPAALGTAFTYQGELNSGGVPETGPCDFEFDLWNAASAGAQVGPTQTVAGLALENGRFTVQLDFGAVFTGDPRWLEVAVRCPATTGSWQTLSPRQAITAVPYAIYAAQAATLVGLSPTAAGQVVKWTGSAWSAQNLYARTVVVSPVGTPVQNGIALRNALHAIVDAGQTNPYLLKIEPGIYDVGTNGFVMKEWVDVEGSGEGVTTIKGTGAATSVGVVRGADNVELRLLTVEATGGTYAIAISNIAASPRLTHVKLVARDGSGKTYTLYNFVDPKAGVSAPVISNTTIVASDTIGDVHGVENAGASPALSDVKIEVSGSGTASPWGMNNIASSSPRLTGVSISVSGASATGIMNNSSTLTMTNSAIDVTATSNGYGMTSYGSSVDVTNTKISVSAASSANGIGNLAATPATLKGVTIIASGGASENTAYYSEGAAAQAIVDSALKAEPTGSSYGLRAVNAGREFVTVNNSQIAGISAISGSSSSIHIGTSQVIGAVSAGVNVRCVFTFDGSYGALNSTCGYP